MFSRKEQQLLLEILKATQTGEEIKIKSTFEYKTINLLEKNDYLVLKQTCPKSVRLSGVGDCLASIIAKHTNTNKKYLKYAGNVRMFIYR